MNISQMIDIALAEDVGPGDITTQLIFDTHMISTAYVIAKQDGIICGIDFFCDTMTKIDESIEFDILKPNGSIVKKNDHVIKLKGPSASILTAERVALNFLGRLSGIATLTHKFVERVKHTDTKILDTRKTTPTFRLIEKFAVRIGGGINHRTGLYDMVLIKDNHIDACGSITQAITNVRNGLKSKAMDHIKIEVEVKNLDELKEAFQLKPDRIMLDNMSINEIKQAVSIVKNDVELEVSGNVSLDNVAEYAETGVDYISVGMITHSAPNFDFSLRFEK